MPPLPISREVRRRFWRLIRLGCSTADAAAGAGVSQGTGDVWFRQAGGMPPLSLVEPVTPSRFLTIDDREKILAGMHQGLTLRAIATSIGRNVSTVSAELRRNMHHPYRCRAGSGQTRDRTYSPRRAQQRADVNKARPKPAKLATNTRLRDEVVTRLCKQQHSPEQISHRLREDFPDDPEMWVSHETIYQSLYVQGRGALRKELTTCLRTGRALRKPRRRAGQRQGRIKDMVNISDRPAEVEDRAVPGHWEGDLITGTNNVSAIGTLVERATGFVMLLHLPHGHTAEAVQQAMIAKMAQLPAILRQTLTWDQGHEMANHVEIAAATDLDIYFCDPHSPWQRGSNENTNGLLRQYFPKGSDLSVFPADYLDYVAAKLNNRPRKRHHWKTPAEVLDQLLSEPFNPLGVAMTA